MVLFLEMEQWCDEMGKLGFARLKNGRCGRWVWRGYLSEGQKKGGWKKYLLFDEEAGMSRGASAEHLWSIVGASLEHAGSMQGAYLGDLVVNVGKGRAVRHLVARRCTADGLWL